MPILLNRYLSSRKSWKWYIYYLSMFEYKFQYVTSLYETSLVVVPSSLWLVCRGPVSQMLVPERYQQILRIEISVLVISATCNIGTILICSWVYYLVCTTSYTFHYETSHSGSCQSLKELAKGSRGHGCWAPPLCLDVAQKLLILKAIVAFMPSIL